MRYHDFTLTIAADEISLVTQVDGQGSVPAASSRTIP